MDLLLTCVCTSIYIHACVCIYIHIDIYIHIYIYINICIHIMDLLLTSKADECIHPRPMNASAPDLNSCGGISAMSPYEHTYVCTYVCTHIHVHNISMHVSQLCLLMNMHICVYVSMYTHTCT